VDLATTGLIGNECVQREEGLAMLFDDFERINGNPSEHGEPLYPFLNRAAGEYWQNVRDLLTEWLSQYPEAERPTLISRFRRTDRRGFLGAFWELYLHEVFRRLGFEIAFHPAVSGATRRPDFRLQLGTAVTYVEAVTIYEPQAHSIGIYPGRGGIIDDHRVIRQRLGEKTRAYGRQLRTPFVIALISYRPTTGFEELLTGLFGAGYEHPEMIRDRAIHRSRLAGTNGFWLTNKGVQYHDASAVLAAFELMPWSVARGQPWLIANPWASHPVDIEFPFNRVAVDTTTGKIERVETDFQPPVHFGLPPDWPHGPPTLSF
jgi:hypothetical protein